MHLLGPRCSRIWRMWAWQHRSAGKQFAMKACLHARGHALQVTAFVQCYPCCRSLMPSDAHNCLQIDWHVLTCCNLLYGPCCMHIGRICTPAESSAASYRSFVNLDLSPSYATNAHESLPPELRTWHAHSFQLTSMILCSLCMQLPASDIKKIPGPITPDGPKEVPGMKDLTQQLNSGPLDNGKPETRGLK